MARILNLFTNLFPVWVLLLCVMALFEPVWFAWFKGPWIVWGLGVIMLGMGMTLSVEDFKKVLTMPLAIAVVIRPTGARGATRPTPGGADGAGRSQSDRHHLLTHF